MLHYKPQDGYFGDPIPFYWDGVYHLFYLKAPLEPKRHGADFTPYAHVSSRDFLTWREHPIVIEPGTKQSDPDAIGCWTGSIIEKDGLFYLFYTGHNVKDENRPQTICVAYSNDLETWRKDPSNPIMLPDPDRFKKSDWRDPFVWWSEAEACYLMSITAMRREDSFWKGGSLVIARSPDLSSWTVGEIYYNPGNHGYPECSDLFKIGKYHYVVASFFHKTCYRVADAELGPWRAVRTECFDGVLNYAAKTIADPENRFVIGWIRTINGEKDPGPWEWAGHMAFPRQMVQDSSDGTLYVKLPEHFSAIRGEAKLDLCGLNKSTAVAGKSITQGTSTVIDGAATYGEIVSTEEHPAEFDSEFRFTVSDPTGVAAVTFRAGATNHPGYEVAIDLKHQEMTLRQHTDHYHRIAVVPITVKAGEPLHLRIIVEDTIVEAFLNDKYAIAGRAYVTGPGARIAVSAEKTKVTLEKATVYELNTNPSSTGLELREAEVGAAVS